MRVYPRNHKKKILLQNHKKKEFIERGVPEKNIRIEIGSASDTIVERPIFYHLIDHELKENDLLLVTKIDRCSRNTLEFLKLQDKLFKKKVTFLSLPQTNNIEHLSIINLNKY